MNLLCPAHDVNHFCADAVHLEKIRPHPFQHDLPVDVHHVGVPDLAPVYHVRHVHARLQFVRLRLYSEDAYLTGFQIIQYLLRQIGQRTRRQILQDPCPVRRPDLLQFQNDGSSDFLRVLIGDDADFFMGCHAQADVHRIAGAGSKFRIE